MKAKHLADALGLTEAQLSKIRNGHVKGIKFEALDHLCEISDCEPGGCCGGQSPNRTPAPTGN